MAQEIINASLGFLSKLSEWILQEYMDLTGRGGDSTKVWTLISHCVRTIFRELHEARVVGRGSFPLSKSGLIVWACLNAHKRLREFLAKGFLADPKPSHILNHHLQDNAVMISQFEKVKQSVQVATQTLSDLGKSLTVIKRTSDQAKTQADKVWKKTKGN